MKSRLIFLLAAPTLLTACLFSPEQIQQRQEMAEQRQQMAAQQYLSQLKTICSNFGYSEGTNEFANCMQQTHMHNAELEQQRQINADRIRAARPTANDIILQEMKRNQGNQRSITTTNCTSSGNAINCNTW